METRDTKTSASYAAIKSDIKSTYGPVLWMVGLRYRGVGPGDSYCIGRLRVVLLNVRDILCLTTNSSYHIPISQKHHMMYAKIVRRSPKTERIKLDEPRDLFASLDGS
jgi:hypothetical protein